MLVNKAKQYLGWAEPTGDDFFINLYNQYTGAGFPMNVAWCAIFVTVIARLCGVSTSNVPNFADCDAGKNWFKNKGRWKNSKAQGGSYTPKRNDVVFYSSRHTMSDSTHVGYVVSVSGNTMKAIEGNKSDAVGYRSISLSDGYIIGYGRVADYIGGSATDDKDDGGTDLASYIVKKGDTLSEIAKAMGTTTSKLASYNGISNPDVIQIGQVIKNPNTGESGASTGTWKATGTATCGGNSVNVRKGPGKSYGSYGYLNKGQRFEVDGKKSGEWIHVKVDGYGIGYIHENYVVYDKAQSSTSYGWKAIGTATCTGNSVNVRVGAGTSYKSVGKLNKGNRFEIDGTEKNGFHHIKVNLNGKQTIAWISSKYVKKD